MRFSSAENDAPLMRLVEKNCSIEYFLMAFCAVAALLAGWWRPRSAAWR